MSGVPARSQWADLQRKLPATLRADLRRQLRTRIPGRRFVQNGEDEWRHLLRKVLTDSLCTITSTQPRDTIARHGAVWILRHDGEVSPGSFVCYTKFLCRRTIVGNLSEVDNMGACLQTGKEYNTANMGHLLCDEQLRARRRFFIWMERVATTHPSLQKEDKRGKRYGFSNQTLNRLKEEVD